MKSGYRYFLAAALGCLLAPHSFAQAGNNNPTGVTGEFNGSITTAGHYDPFTGNAKRIIDDIVVPGSIGAYPLKWSRILNTRGVSSSFGDACGWSHSYAWGLWVRSSNPPPLGGENQYVWPLCGVSYPDGRCLDMWSYASALRRVEVYGH